MKKFIRLDTFRITLRHDEGVATFRTKTPHGIEDAIQKVLIAEGAPPAAVESAKKIKTELFPQ